jgi:hypothetical protein
MNIADIATVIALLAGPALGVGMTFYFQNRNFVRGQRVELLKTLLSLRAEPLNPERIRALATIDVVFSDKPSVRAKWKEFFESVTNPALAGNQNAGFVWMTKQNEMLAEMAKTVGLGRAIGYEELSRMYSPQSFVDNVALLAESQKEFLRVLKASENFGTPKKAEAEVLQLKPPSTGT